MSREAAAVLHWGTDGFGWLALGARASCNRQLHTAQRFSVSATKFRTRKKPFRHSGRCSTVYTRSRGIPHQAEAVFQGEVHVRFGFAASDLDSRRRCSSQRLGRHRDRATSHRAECSRRCGLRSAPGRHRPLCPRRGGQSGTDNDSFSIRVRRSRRDREAHPVDSGRPGVLLPVLEIGPVPLQRHGLRSLSTSGLRRLFNRSTRRRPHCQHDRAGSDLYLPCTIGGFSEGGNRVPQAPRKPRGSSCGIESRRTVGHSGSQQRCGEVD